MLLDGSVSLRRMIFSAVWYAMHLFGEEVVAMSGGGGQYAVRENRRTRGAAECSVRVCLLCRPRFGSWMAALNAVYQMPLCQALAAGNFSGTCWETARARNIERSYPLVGAVEWGHFRKGLDAWMAVERAGWVENQKKRKAFWLREALEPMLCWVHRHDESPSVVNINVALFLSSVAFNCCLEGIGSLVRTVRYRDSVYSSVPNPMPFQSKQINRYLLRSPTMSVSGKLTSYKSPLASLPSPKCHRAAHQKDVLFFFSLNGNDTIEWLIDIKVNSLGFWRAVCWAGRPEST